jgi:hypothetical protein
MMVAGYGGSDYKGDLSTMVALGFCSAGYYTNSSLHTSTISITRDPVKHEHTKHIGVDASYTRSQVHDQV